MHSNFLLYRLKWLNEDNSVDFFIQYIFGESEQIA
jgi:hypothetical protein